MFILNKQVHNIDFFLLLSSPCMNIGECVTLCHFDNVEIQQSFKSYMKVSQ